MTKKTTLKISGMHCASCSANLTKNLKKEAAVSEAEVNFNSGKADITYDENSISLNDIKKIVADTGYRVVDNSADSTHADHVVENNEERSLKIKVVLASALALPMLLRMVWMWEVPGSFLEVSTTDWIQHNMTFVVVFILGWQFHRNAFNALKRGQFDMDSLISLGTLAAYFYSTYAMTIGAHLYFEGAATITALILLGRYLETKTRDRASR